LTLVVAALAVGGTALAQPQLVADPWGSASAEVDSWFGPSANQRPDVTTADPVLVDPWQTVRAPEPRAKRVEVFPVAPATNAPQKSASPLPPAAPLVIDPWAPAVGSEIPSLERGPLDQLSPWSGRMIEVVDPWGRAPRLSVEERVRLIIDPWAR
jgi:hypothetical protein